MNKSQEDEFKYYSLLFDGIGKTLGVHQSDINAATKQFKQIMFSQIVGVEEFLTIIELMPGIFRPFCSSKNITIGNLRDNIYNKKLTPNELLLAVEMVNYD